MHDIKTFSPGDVLMPISIFFELWDPVTQAVIHFAHAKPLLIYLGVRKSSFRWAYEDDVELAFLYQGHLCASVIDYDNTAEAQRSLQDTFVHV